ncbi:MAG: hypothetical protein HQL80_11660 [Magnetococcales bacterium]|nr:hypothetical protein [Magnetococcales bacterium]
MITKDKSIVLDKQPPEATEEGTSKGSEYPEYLKPRLRLFLSIDLVGSTALKQGKMGERQGGGTPDLDEYKRSSLWRAPILDFYQNFQYIFALKWKRAEEELKLEDTNNSNLDKPEFWKALGDELIYNQLISTAYQACWCVRAWISAAEDFREKLRGTFPALDVKMAAWIAGFPVINSEVVLQKNTDDLLQQVRSGITDSMAALMQQLKSYYSSDKSKAVLDYMGPSMDIGFRLCSLSTPREMPISLELAYILSKVRRDLTERENRLRDQPEPGSRENHLPAPALRYMGRKSLKGVLNGRPYPVFWLDVAGRDPVEAAEDAISSREEITSDQCLKLFEAFVKEVNNPLLIWEPYLSGLHDDKVIKSDRPSVHKELLDNWLNTLKEKEDATSLQEESEDTNSAATKDLKSQYKPEDLSIKIV